MTNNFLSVGAAVALIVTLVLLSDPFMLWMPMGLQFVLLLGAAVLVCVWAGFVMYEKARDEREVALTMRAGRVAYLSGIAVLTIALIYQGLTHTSDPWVLLALGVMVISKLGARLYAERYR